MVTELQITRVRGGNRHPLSRRGFILDYLLIAREDYIASMHRAYKAELVRLARQNGRRTPYHRPVYHSFEVEVNRLAREGLIEFSGREEESDNPMFANKEWKPVRRYYQLRASAGTVIGREDGHKPGSGTRDGHGGDTVPEKAKPTSQNRRKP